MNLDTYFGAHEVAIQQRMARTHVLASNIANSDTPHYKARDLVFADTLDHVRQGADSTSRRTGTLAMTDAQHFGGSASGIAGTGAERSGGRLMYRVPAAASLDGNTVDKDMEQARFAENALRYQASVQFLQNRTASLLKSLRGE